MIPESPSKFDLSIVATIYNFAGGLSKLCESIKQALSNLELSYEVILIDDGSSDGSFKAILEESRKDNRIKGVRMLRNFGQHTALSAGLHLSNGRHTVIMDGDMQDHPTLIPELYNEIISTEAEVVYVRRKNRKDSSFKRLSSKWFYGVLNSLSGIEFNHEIGTYRIMSRFAVDSFKQFKESEKFIGGLFHWMDLPSAYLDAEHQERLQGRSGYSLKKLIRLAERGIIGYSFKPLNLAIYLGFLSAIIAFAIGFYYLLMKFMNNSPVPGYTSIIVSIFFMGGLILLVLGIFGKYLAQILLQVRERPEYILHNFTDNWDE